MGTTSLRSQYCLVAKGFVSFPAGPVETRPPDNTDKTVIEEQKTLEKLAGFCIKRHNLGLPFANVSQIPNPFSSSSDLPSVTSLTEKIQDANSD